MRSVALPLLALGILAACSSAPQPDPPAASTIGSTSSSIINGSPDTSHDAVVAVLTQSSQDQGGGCTGTIVKVDGTRHIGWVVTAAHCVDFAGLDPTNVYVVQGEDFGKNSSILYRAIDFAIHPSWAGENGGFDYDFAVIRIAGVDASTPVIPLTSNPDGLGIGKTVTSVGYGKTDPSPSSNEQNTLRYAVTKTLGSVGSTQIAYSNTSSGICQGDSGGPVLYGTAGNEKVVGIHSYVQGGCAGSGASGHSSRVVAGLGFLNGQLSATLPKEDCNLCELVANSGTQECAEITQRCYGDPECQGFFECMQQQGATRAGCTAKYPKIEGMYAAVAACTCTRACADSCGSTLNCKLTPKCGYKLPAGACTTCTEASCCAETFDCTADGDCYLCLKNGDQDPGCATNALRKKLATCVATSCKADCEGSGLDTGADPPGEEGTDPEAENGGGGGAAGTKTTTTTGCALAAAPRAPANAPAFGVALGLAAALAFRRVRSAGGSRSARRRGPARPRCGRRGLRRTCAR